MRMIRTGKFADKKILLIDKNQKTTNDRTWCFWEKENGFFEETVYRKWDTISFFGEDISLSMPITPYRYKMIRGIDFYNYCFTEIGKHKNIEVVYTEIGKWWREKNNTIIILDNLQFSLGWPVVFNSVYEPQIDKHTTIKLLQHFKGWMIETDKPVFNTVEATMMDFRVHQNYGTTFTYVLPVSDKTALVEYTLFSKKLLQLEQYDSELKNYIKTILQIDNYTIKEEEFGIIPMTNEKFSFAGKAWNIGAAGGQTKASSGYTFQFIQKQSRDIVECLINGKSLKYVPETPARFRFYDNTLLDVLYNNTFPGKGLFTRLFKKNKPQQVLKFLDNESTWAEELKIISSLPVWPFLKAALKQL